MGAIINPRDWGKPDDRWHGEIEGAPYGAGLSLIFNVQERVGAGPRLHRHPYPETFIVRAGRGLFTIGDITVEATAGQILVAPANTPHKFANLGPGLLESIDIHASETFVTEWLE